MKTFKLAIKQSFFVGDAKIVLGIDALAESERLGLPVQEGTFFFFIQSLVKVFRVDQHIL